MALILSMKNSTNQNFQVKVLNFQQHRINNSCTWGSKHALVIRGLKLGQIRNLGG
jgi:hypothetical protein